MRRMLRWEWRHAKRSADNVPVYSLGARIGYWPCLGAPFIQLSVWCWVLDAWYGQASLCQLEAGDR